MKKIIETISAVMLILSMATACEDGREVHYANKVFMKASSLCEEVRVQIDENQTSAEREIVVAMADVETRDINVSVNADEGKLVNYRNIFYDMDAEVLGPDFYEIKDSGSSIPSGQVTGRPVAVGFRNLDRLDYSVNHVLPVSISNADIDVLESSRTIYFVVKKAGLINVVADLNENRAWPEWKDAAPLSAMDVFTLEVMANARAFQNPEISTIMGIEDVFLIRVGDNGLPKNQLQVAWGFKDESGETSRGGISNSKMKMNLSQWYHIAVTFNKGIVKVYMDGKLRGEGDASASGLLAVNFSVPHSDEADGKPRCFWFGYSYDSDRSFNGRIAEARIWNRALDEEEINAENHFYKVSPDSDGLVAYWKFNEGSGKVSKDQTGHGNDVVAEKNVVWTSVSLPE